MRPHPLPTGNIQLLGAFEVRLCGRTVRLHRSAQRLVAYVALQERAVDRDRIAEALWPDQPVPLGLGRVRDVLYKIRSALPHLMRADAQRVRLSAATTLDVTLARTVATRTLRETDDPSGLVEGVEGVAATPIELFGADLLPGWDEEWLVGEQQDFALLRLRALERLAEDLLTAGRFTEAEHACRAVIHAEPYRETAHLLLARVYRDEGNAGQALRALSDFQRKLQRDLGLGASVPMQQLARSIRAVSQPVEAVS